MLDFGTPGLPLILAFPLKGGRDRRDPRRRRTGPARRARTGPPRSHSHRLLTTGGFMSTAAAPVPITPPRPESWRRLRIAQVTATFPPYFAGTGNVAYY